MSDVRMLTTEESFLERMKAARNVSAVLKARLLILRSNFPSALVFAFEGDDDKIVYGQWVRRIRPELRYEPFPCGGKEGVRGLKNSVARDLAGLGERIFFFVDRDFDDLQGFVDVSNVFMTETYSVENCLVADEVLKELLRDEFPCHARPDLRKSIVEIFNNDYRAFLTAATEINLRIFYARRIPIKITVSLPTSLRHLAVVRIGNVSRSDSPVDKVVILEREPTADEQAGLSTDFASLAPKSRFRGKFALKFFTEWLGRLADELGTDDLGVFGSDPLKGGVRRNEFVLSNFATKSGLPADLPAFVCAIK